MTQQQQIMRIYVKLVTTHNAVVTMCSGDPTSIYEEYTITL